MPALTMHPEKCTHCFQCELACTFVQTGSFGVYPSLVKVYQFDEEAAYTAYTCTQCDEAWCMMACPVDAIVERDGFKVVLEELCIGCRLCGLACPFGTIFFKQDGSKAAKCTTCLGEPACAVACPTGAIEWAEGPKDWGFSAWADKVSEGAALATV